MSGASLQSEERNICIVMSYARCCTEVSQGPKPYGPSKAILHCIGPCPGLDVMMVMMMEIRQRRENDP
jgi:hypothetical protein